MVSTDEIYNKFERDNIPKIDERSQEILDACHELIAPLLDMKFFGSYPSNMLYNIKNRFVYDSSCCDYFFELLKEHNYNANEEIKSAILELSYPIFNRLSGNITLKYIKSPYIDSIEPTEHGFKINSEQLGEFAFDFADHYYCEQPQITDYIYHEKLRGRCNHHVNFLTEQDPNLYSVTALVETIYLGYTFYHSYCWDKDNNKIIDLSSNIVMDKQQYDRLFKCEEIFMIEGRHLVEAATTAKQNNMDLESKVNPLAVALFQQYIWENNLTSPNPDIYSEQPQNKKLLMKNRFGSNN